MKSGLSKKLSELPNVIRDTVNAVLKEYINRIYTEAMSRAPQAAKGKYTVEIHPNEMRVELWTEDRLAAYLEFGTGDYAAKLLAGQPTEVSEDAIQFFVTGKGTLPAQPYLFPTYYKYKDKIAPEIDKRIQKHLDKW